MARVPFGLALAAATVVATAAQQQPPTVFRGTTESVPVYVTVTDKSNRLVTSLARENFEVFDNGKAQPLVAFDNTPQPIRLIVMLDVSGSMEGNLPLLREATEELFTRLRPDDMVRVGTFGKSIDISPTFTNNPATLRASLPREIAPDALTPLWRGTDAAIAALAGSEGRHVILLLSDGKDNPPYKFGDKFVNQLDVVDRAQREEVMIYGIGFHSRSRNRPIPAPGANLGALLAADFPDPGLGTAALDTGGGYFEVRPRDDLSAAFARVADELHSQYLLGFAPSARDGKQHKIEVKLDVKDVKPRARKNYVAPKAS